MPRVRRRAKRRTCWTDAHKRALLMHDWFLDVFADDAAERAAWEHLRDGLLPAWIAEHPGTRPRAWWKFDMPAGTRRERIDGEPHPHDQVIPGEYVDPDRRLFFGKAQRVAMRERNAEYETQGSFLERHDLLTADERRALKKKRSEYDDENTNSAGTSSRTSRDG